MNAGVSQHAMVRLVERFPVFGKLPRRDVRSLLSTSAYLGRRLKRICRKAANNNRIYIRAENIYGTGEDFVMILNRSDHPRPQHPYSILTVITYDQYLELRRAAREERPVRKTDR